MDGSNVIPFRSRTNRAMEQRAERAEAPASPTWLGHPDTVAAFEKLARVSQAQCEAVQEWRAKMAELSDEVGDLKTSLQDYRETLGTVGRGVEGLGRRSRRLATIAGRWENS